MRAFRLFPEAQHWCSLADYGAILSVMERLRPTSVLEFGPGWSTLALIEGGAASIDCCEDDPHWAATWRERLNNKHHCLTVRPYDWADPLTIPAVDVLRPDLGLVDGPHDITLRPAVMDYCLQRCRAVLVPLETSHGLLLMHAVERLAKQHARTVEFMESGPLAGAFALLTC